jgi:23S rRNA (pseudouridine1915-N3)-methyltransferase
MRVIFASITGRGKSQDLPGRLAEEYLERLAIYGQIEARNFRSEAALFESLDRIGGRTAPLLAMLDSRGKTFSSEHFAHWIGQQRDGGLQTMIFAVGPADGWTKAAVEKASLVLSLGPMTLPHELARVVLVEQVYRAFTILANHPYHGGH